MRNCDQCKAGMSDVEHRWEVSEEWQKCIPTAGGPEVDISFAYVLGEYCAEDHALDAIASYLDERKAKMTWADVSPVEICACCGKNFATAGRHLTLTLMELSGPDETPNIHDSKYVARFCRTCVPPEGNDSKPDTSANVVTIARPAWVGND